MKTTIKNSVGFIAICALVLSGYAFTLKNKEVKKMEVNCMSSEQSVIDYLVAHGYTIYSLHLSDPNTCERIADTQYIQDDILVHVTEGRATSHQSIPHVNDPINND